MGIWGSTARQLARIGCALVCVGASLGQGAERVAEYVIHISVDGCGSFYLQKMIAAKQLPNFKRFLDKGAATLNARTDFDYTITLPNHTCMVTGRPVMDKQLPDRSVAGHLYTNNEDPKPGVTLHSTARAYVQSTFAVAHDNGLSTALYSSKTKFSLYDVSYNEANGAPDTTGDDNGRDKIDVTVIDEDAGKLTATFVSNMRKDPTNYTFLHFRNPDSAGHSKKWGSAEYTKALKEVNGYLAQVFELITKSPKLLGKTTVILSADHGGVDLGHSNNSDPLVYAIPFFVMGNGAAKGADLYELNASTRANPGKGRVDYNAAGLQPIRNGDGGNLALSLLGLGPIPDSLINFKQDLKGN